MMRRYLRPTWLLYVVIAVLVQSAGARLAGEIGKIEHYADNLRVWQSRAESIRMGILSGAQLLPLPRKTPLYAISSHRRTRDGYSVENIAFQSVPGFYVFGNLYRPLHASGKLPAILVPHGHFKSKIWFARTRPENQILCARLAQIGAVVFTYDMVGWGDSTQINHNVSNVLQLQLWDSIRAVDFLQSLPYVDGERIGVTGASGGATQTIYLAAVDPRIKASMPVAMVSASYTGHERCEDGMPVHDVPGETRTNNAEIAAVIAPRPLLIVSDGADWTKHFPTDAYPYVQRVYSLFDAISAVENAHLAHEKHDYGPSKRALAYRFFVKSLGLQSKPFPSSGKVSESEELDPNRFRLSQQEDQTVRKWIVLPPTKRIFCEQAVTQLLRNSSVNCPANGI